MNHPIQNFSRFLRSRPCVSSQRRFLQSSPTLLQKDPEWVKTHKKSPQGGADIPENLSARQRAIIYRCKQRGWLELDILLGNWAVKHVPAMQNNDEKLEQIEALLAADTPDMLVWVLGHKPPPKQFQNETFQSIRKFVSGEVSD